MKFAGMSLPRKLEHPALISVLLALAILAAYFPVAGLDFTNYDDPEYVAANPQVSAGLSWQGVGWAVGSAHAANWHPVTWLSHMADCEIFGLHPAGHHLTNLVFHAANSILLFLLLRSLTGACWRSAAVAALFALHPLHVESVAWVSERKDVLSGFFGFLCLWAYSRSVNLKSEVSNPETPRAPPVTRHSSLFYGLALVFFALGLMSKPMLVTWPCVMLLLDYWPLRRFERSGFKSQLPMLRRLIMEKIPFFALSAVSCVITILAQKAGGAMAPLEPLPLTQRACNAVVSYVRYMGKLVWPTDLAVIYPLGGRWPVALVLLAVAALAGVSLLALWQRKQRPWLLAGWAWYLGTLMPVIGIVQVGSQSMADRYTYLPAIGLFLILAWGVAELAGTAQIRRALAGVAAAGALSACVLVTQRQVLHWHNAETLFRHALAVTPKNFIACNQLGLYFASQQQMEAAQHWYHEALAIHPGHQHAWNNLGCVLTDLGKYDEAIAHFETALRLDPTLVSAHNSLGAALLKQGKTDEALRHFLEALRLRPGYAQTHYNLANALVAKGQASQAIDHYRRALQLNPRWADACNNLAFLQAQAGNLDEAVSAFRAALRLQPELWQAHYGLGECLAKQGKQAEAADEFLLLAAAHAAAGRFEEAVKAATRAGGLARAAGRSDLSQTSQKQRELYRSRLRGGSHLP
jgi:protein O-mannosyl-transferase